jgi:hypothetical protein
VRFLKRLPRHIRNRADDSQFRVQRRYAILYFSAVCTITSALTPDWT